MLTFGNHKLGDDTAIFNMGSALLCPSRRLNLCKLDNIRCYADKAEVQYKEPVIHHREEQGRIWKNSTSQQLCSLFYKKISNRRKETRYLRFNEAGDFHCQEDIIKLNEVSKSLRDNLSIITYGYTARSDLDFSNVEFLVKGSGWSGPGLNGSTIVIKKDQDIPEDYIQCPGTGKNGCSRCNLCKINVPYNIAFRAH